MYSGAREFTRCSLLESRGGVTRARDDINDIEIVDNSFVLKLRQLSRVKLPKVAPLSVSLSDNNLIAAASTCAYVIDANEVVARKCADGWMNSVSYCCNAFVFVGWGGTVYIYREDVRRWNDLFLEDIESLTAIRALEEGILIGWNELKFVTYDGHVKWSLEMPEVYDSPAVIHDIAYVPRINWPSEGRGAVSVVELNSGTVMGSLEFDEEVWSVDACGEAVVVGSSSSVYFLDVRSKDNPRIVWKIGDLGEVHDVAFSPDCSYVLAAMPKEQALVVIDVKRRKVYEVGVKNGVTDVDWKGEKVVLGTDAGEVLTFEVSYSR